MKKVRAAVSVFSACGLSAEVVIGEGRSLFRVQDLIDLARLVGGLVGERSLEASDEV